MITTVLAAGGSAPGNNTGDASGESDWDAGLLASLDVPVLQGLCLTSSRAQWEASNAALAPIDAAMQVAIPEFDGRVITVPFSLQAPRNAASTSTGRERSCRASRMKTASNWRACFGSPASPCSKVMWSSTPCCFAF